MASTAGCHFFKCPLCNNTSEFREEMMQFGIYVPDQVCIIETDLLGVRENVVSCYRGDLGDQ
jgi:hypothetical protein